MYTSQPNHSIIRNYNQAQGITHPTDLSYQIIRHYGLRYVSIQNSSTRPIGIAITSYISGPTPPILTSLAAGEIRPLGVNSHGGSPQYLWLLDVQTEQPVGAPEILATDGQDFVLRDGVGKWWVQKFKRASYSAAF